MAKGINIDIASDTRAFASGVKSGVISPLEDVVDTLDEVERESKQAGNKLERSMEDAQKETKDLGREYKELADTVKRESRDAGRDLDRNLGDATHSASGNVSEFKSEAVANFSEVTSSFDGSMSSITDLAQGTFGGLAALPGALGLAAGGAAIAVGLIGAAIEGVGESTDADIEAAGEWAQAYIEAGSKILTSAQLIAGAQDIITDPEKFKTAKTNAELWGTSVATAVLAMAGNQDALAEATANVDKAGQQAISTANEAAASNRDLTKTEIEYNSAQANARGTLNEIIASMELGAVQADVYSEALRLTAQNTDGAKLSVDEFGDSVYALPDGTSIYIDAETGQATQDTDAIANKIYSLQDKTVKVILDADQAKTDYANLFLNPKTVSVKVLVPNSPLKPGVNVP